MVSRNWSTFVFVVASSTGQPCQPGAHANGQHRPGHAVHAEFDADQHADHPKARRGPLLPDGEAQQHGDDAVKQNPTPGREVIEQGDGDAEQPDDQEDAASMRVDPQRQAAGIEASGIRRPHKGTRAAGTGRTRPSRVPTSPRPSVPAAMRSRTPSITTEARVELKAKPTAKVPTMIWTIPKARNQPSLRMSLISTATTTAARLLRVGSHGLISGERLSALPTVRPWKGVTPFFPRSPRWVGGGRRSRGPRPYSANAPSNE